MPYLLLAAAIAGALFWRARYLRTIERRSRERRPLGADGIVVGGEGFELTRPGAPGVLLLHGGGDTPQTLRYLGDFLHQRGFSVSAPLLPAHGRTVQEFSSMSPDRLLAAARSALASLRALGGGQAVGVIGVSMGGALAVQLAAEDPQIGALGLVAPYLVMPPRIERAARLAWVWGPLVPLVRSGDGVSILDPAERTRNLAYGVFSAKALAALYAVVERGDAALPRVHAPTLFIQSREDNRISVAAAERAFSRLGASDKRLVWVTGAAHIITVDYGRERVFEALAGWMDERLRPAVEKAN